MRLIGLAVILNVGLLGGTPAAGRPPYDQSRIALGRVTGLILVRHGKEGVRRSATHLRSEGRHTGCDDGREKITCLEGRRC
jgi:hypothetical protein